MPRKSQQAIQQEQQQQWGRDYHGAGILPNNKSMKTHHLQQETLPEVGGGDFFWSSRNRGGGGNPLRDSMGNVSTLRRKPITPEDAIEQYQQQPSITPQNSSRPSIQQHTSVILQNTIHRLDEQTSSTELSSPYVRPPVFPQPRFAKVKSTLQGGGGEIMTEEESRRLATLAHRAALEAQIREKADKKRQEQQQLEEAERRDRERFEASLEREQQPPPPQQQQHQYKGSTKSYPNSAEVESLVSLPSLVAQAASRQDSSHAFQQQDQNHYYEGDYGGSSPGRGVKAKPELKSKIPVLKKSVRFPKTPDIVLPHVLGATSSKKNLDPNRHIFMPDQAHITSKNALETSEWNSKMRFDERPMTLAAPKRSINIVERETPSPLSMLPTPPAHTATSRNPRTHVDGKRGLRPRPPSSKHLPEIRAKGAPQPAQVYSLDDPMEQPLPGFKKRATFPSQSAISDQEIPTITASEFDETPLPALVNNSSSSPLPSIEHQAPSRHSGGKAKKAPPHQRKSPVYDDEAPKMEAQSHYTTDAFDEQPIPTQRRHQKPQEQAEEVAAEYIPRHQRESPNPTQEEHHTISSPQLSKQKQIEREKRQERRDREEFTRNVVMQHLALFHDMLAEERKTVSAELHETDAWLVENPGL